MRKLVKDPLLQFMLIGFLFYGVFTLFAPESQQANDPTIITINDEALLRHLQAQDKVFDRTSATKTLAALDTESRTRLEDEFIRDEIMVREAIKLGFDQDDEVIRGRLIQKMDFIMQGFAATDNTVTEPELLTFFARHKQDYRREAEATFTHVFFSTKTRTLAEATSAASELLTTLNQTSVPFEKAGEYGERFYFLRNYVKRPKRLISDHFGPEMTADIFTQTANGKWAGPLLSQYGVHLVMVRTITPERDPDMAEVADQILANIRRANSDKARAKALQKLMEKYTIERTANAIELGQTP